MKKLIDYPDYDEIKKLIKGCFDSSTEFYDWTENNIGHGIPSRHVYRNDGSWISWYDFLGTKKVEYWSFEKARKFVQKLKLKGQKDWVRWNRKNTRPNGLPMACDKVYRNEWNGFADFFGTGNERLRSTKLNYNEAKEFVSKLKLKNLSDWFEYARSDTIPDNVPKDPFDKYSKDGSWISWNDFLNSDVYSSVAKSQFLCSFDEARTWARKLNLKTQSEWNEYGKNNGLPKHINSQPNKTYKGKGWKGWGDFLGSGKPNRADRLSLDEARSYLRKLNIGSVAEFRLMHKEGKIDKRIPISLHASYCKDKNYKGTSDMLGNNRCFNYLSFEEAKKVVKELGIKSQNEYYQAINNGIISKELLPSQPQRVYSKGSKHLKKITVA